MEFSDQLVCKEGSRRDLRPPHPALALSSDTISAYLKLSLEAEISVDQPLEGNRTKHNGTSPTFHSHQTALKEHSSAGCTLLFLPGALKEAKDLKTVSRGFPAPGEGCLPCNLGTLSSTSSPRQMALKSLRKVREAS